MWGDWGPLESSKYRLIGLFWVNYVRCIGRMALAKVQSFYTQYSRIIISFKDAQNKIVLPYF